LTLTFSVTIQESLKKVEALMMAQADGYQSDLKAALELLVSAGGKRVRPMVTILTGRMFHADEDRLVTLAAAIELLHTATLVHDDLIDGSLLRRGNPTLNAQWSPGATVLTGDFVFARSAMLAACTDSVELMKVFSETLSIIVNGEISQLFSSRCLADREQYSQRIYAKTASLFETSARTAAILAKASDVHCQAMANYGRSIGMAFQIMDDILDFTGAQHTLGKPVGSDLRQGIITLPTIYFAENNPSDPAGASLLAGRCLDGDEVDRAILAVRTSPAVQQSQAEADRFIDLALVELRGLPACPERDSLEEIARYITRRNN
jgi:geranylgeranyl pyrophosphate synthase